MSKDLRDCLKIMLTLLAFAGIYCCLRNFTQHEPFTWHQVYLYYLKICPAAAMTLCVGRAVSMRRSEPGQKMSPQQKIALLEMSAAGLFFIWFMQVATQVQILMMELTDKRTASGDDLVMFAMTVALTGMIAGLQIAAWRIRRSIKGSSIQNNRTIASQKEVTPLTSLTLPESRTLEPEVISVRR